MNEPLEEDAEGQGGRGVRGGPIPNGLWTEKGPADVFLNKIDFVSKKYVVRHGGRGGGSSLKIQHCKGVSGEGAHWQAGLCLGEKSVCPHTEYPPPGCTEWVASVGGAGEQGGSPVHSLWTTANTQPHCQYTAPLPTHSPTA